MEYYYYYYYYNYQLFEVVLIESRTSREHAPKTLG